MLIGIDIDGVLFPWDDVARDALVTKFDIERPGPSTSWTYLKDVLEPSQWSWLWSAQGQDYVFGRVERTYAEAVPVVNALLKAGHRVHFVTHRDPRRTVIHTARFLALHFGGHPWAGVHVVQNSVAKRHLQRWDVFVDDKPDTVLDFLDNTDARVFAPARPWNVELQEVERFDVVNGLDTFTRYTHPDEILKWVEARS